MSKLDILFQALSEAKKLTGHTEYVIVGSLSALVHEDSGRLPRDMVRSNDFDAYTRADPGRILDVAHALGEGSAFFEDHDMYIDPVTPKLLTLPEGWEDRMAVIDREGIKAFFLDADDAAVSKYTRGAPNDIRWIRAGIESGLIDLQVVRDRLKTTSFLDAAEDAATKARVIEDIRIYLPAQDPGEEPAPKVVGPRIR